MKPEVPSSKNALYVLFNDEWEFRMREDPIMATSYGDHRYNDRLPSVTPGDFQRRAAQVVNFLERLRAIDRSTLDPSDQINYDFFGRVLHNQAADYDFNIHLMPVTKNAGLHILLPDLITVTPFDTLQDYENYLKRLNGINTYARQTIELMQAGMSAGVMPPRPALEGTLEALQKLISSEPEASLFFRPFDCFPGTIQAAQRSALFREGAAAIRSSVIPGFRAMIEFIRDIYLPAARLEPGASALTNGQAYYQYCIRKFTTLDLSAEQVHATGLEEVQRIRAEMEDLIRTTGFEGSFHQFIQILRSEPRFYVDTPEALLEKAALIMKRMDGELPRLFKKLPHTPYGIRQIPEHSAPNSTSAYYFPSTGDGRTAGYYYVNTYDLKSRPLYEYEALGFHEAVPGHHLQLALQVEMGEVPNFRRYGDMTAFIEGWALYAERLGLEVGFYQDPYSNFGRMTFEMWRAVRLVVDTGLHALGWSRQQAIDYMAENTALSLLNIINEIDRYIAWPGQALAYKIGELKIRELRRLAEQSMGEQFDLREFHAEVLENGSLPLDVLEAVVRRWIGL